MFMNTLSRYREAGLLLLRLGLGASMAAHGIPKLAAGPDAWVNYGRATQNIGISFAPAFWGFMAGFAESVGGVLIAFGFLFRPALILLLIPTMIVAMMMHMGRGDGFSRWSHAMELLIVFVSLILIGPGKYSVDEGMPGGRR